MKAGEKEPDFRRCASCGEIKSKAQFRYIKYFQKRRKICRRCEKDSRKKEKLIVEKHVEEFGVTSGVLKKLHLNARKRISKIKNDPLLKIFSKEEIRSVQLGLLVSRICNLGIFLSFGILLLAILHKNFWWIGGAVVIWLITQTLETTFCQPRIGWQSPIYKIIVKDELNNRLKYEKFYASIEWKILRESFLRKQKKINGCFVCEYCKGPVEILDLSVDHFMPRSKYPDLALEILNLRVSHRACNSSKGDRELI